MMNLYENDLETLIEKRKELEQELQNMIENDAYENQEENMEVDQEEEYESSPAYRVYEVSSEIDVINEKIGEIYYKREKELYEQEYKEKIINYSKGSVISDAMNKEDLFNRRQRAETLAQYIVDEKTQPPFNIGVFARWGEGKTTFLDYLKEELESLNKKGKSPNNKYCTACIVNYDASEYEEKDRIWASIMKSMFLQYEKTTWFPKFFYNLKKFLRDKKKFITHILSYLLSLAVVCVLSACSINTLWKDWEKQRSILVGGSATIMAIIVLITKLIIPTIKGLLQSAVPLSDKIVNNISLPNYINKLGERENIKRDLSILVDAWLNRWRKGRKRIVLIVDELDRCSEKGIIEFFQSMQLFLKIPQIIIIFAIDQEYLNKSLSNSFKIVNNKERDQFMLEYLDKYINMPVLLDTQIKYSTYVDYLLSNVIKDEAYFSFSIGESKVIKSTIETIPNSFLTPRKVKKIINMLIISKETCVLLNKKNKGEEIIDFRQYIIWFLFSYFYEEAADKILKDFKGFCRYYKIKRLLSKILKEERGKITNLVNDNQIMELVGEITLKDIYIYERILSGFTKIV